VADDSGIGILAASSFLLMRLTPALFWAAHEGGPFFVRRTKNLASKSY